MVEVEIDNNKAELELLVSKIKTYDDFPKPGIKFFDIFSILGNSEMSKLLWKHTMRIINDYLTETGTKIDYVVGLESRGFLIGTVIAERLSAGFVPIRKHTKSGSKLPGDVVNVVYTTEYSSDSFDLQLNYLEKGKNVMLVDDLVATGGSLRASQELIEKAGCKVVTVFCAFELSELNGRKKVNDLKENSFLSLIKV